VKSIIVTVVIFIIIIIIQQYQNQSITSTHHHDPNIPKDGIAVTTAIVIFDFTAAATLQYSSG
jgi:hypothetical protein